MAFKRKENSPEKNTSSSQSSEPDNHSKKQQPEKEHKFHQEENHHSHTGHSHTGLHTHLHDSSVSNIKTAFFVNLVFCVIEFVGAYFSNSIAIASDAIHDFGDSLALGLAWILAILSTRKKNSLFTYGFQRLSLLGALINTIVLFIGSLVVLYHALPRLWNPEVTHSSGMLALAVVGIIVNGYAVYKTSKGKNLNEKTVSLHLLEDVLGWIAVAITSVIMMLTDLYILDPILSILIVIYILRGVVKNFKATVLLFLQASPTEIKTQKIEKIFTSHKLVKGVHDVHIWSLDGDKHILSAHVVVGKNSLKKNITSIKTELKKKLRESGIEHATLEVEFEDEVCKNINSC